MISRTVKFIKYIFSILFILVSIIYIVTYFSLNKELISKDTNKLCISDKTGINQDQINTITDNLIDYIKDDSNTIAYEFSEIEILHMKDVKDLYQNLILFRNISIIVISVSLIILIVFKEYKDIYYYFDKVINSFIAAIVFIMLFCIIDFEVFWTDLHNLLFNNNYWNLDPNTSLLINIVPTKYFYILCIRIVLCILVLFTVFKLIIRRIDRGR